MKLKTLLFSFVALLCSHAQAQAPEVKSTPVAGSVHMLTGGGGNIGVSAGADGSFMIDDQFAPMTDAIRGALEKLKGWPPRFVLNTHWHDDHTGGNENMGKAGAVIVAHDQVRTRLTTDQFVKAFDKKVPASPAAALPVVTFTDTVTFHLNGDEIHVFHVPPAHTDGDSLVHFRKANVLHMGDTFFSGMYPFVDVDNGGSVSGVIAAVDRALNLADAKTKIIPGHGPLGTRSDLESYREMLAGIHGKVEALHKAGKTLEEIQAAKPSAYWDAKWGKGFLNPEQFVQIVYESVKK